MKAVDEAGGPTVENLRAVPTLGAPEGLAKATEELFAASLLLGLDHASGKLELDDASFSLPFEEAVTFLKGRVPLTKPEWKDLEPKLRFRAFTVSALSTPDAVERVRTLAIGAVEKGTPLADFWSAAKAENAAGLGESPWYWETVYRTNIQTEYNAGRAIEFKRNQPEYLEFVGIGDVRQTDICRSRSGTILPATHPFWKTSWPPLHFNCRTTIRAVYAEEVEAIREANPDWRPTAEESIPREGAATGFGGNPVDEGSFWKMTAAMRDRAEKLGLIPAIERLAGDLGIPSKEIDIVPTYKAAKYPKMVKVKTTSTIVRNEPDPIASFQAEARELIGKGLNSEEKVRELGDLILARVRTENKPGSDSREAVFNTLRQVRAFGSDMKHSYAKGSSIAGRKAFESCQALFPKEWLEKSVLASTTVSPLMIKLDKVRGYYQPLKSLLSLPESAPKVAHELAHRIEHVIPELVKMEKAFYDRRTKGEALESLRALTGNSAYAPYEVAKKDKFLHPYIGRDYGGRAYEILSMGIESLAGGQYDIIRDDPDFASFILGMLAGG